MSPTTADPSAETKTYKNDPFGVSFQFPDDWFGPEEYVSDGQLRVEVGSDNVYPYGTDPTARIQDRPDSYYVLVQFYQNDQNKTWQETFDSLRDLDEGESLSTARSLLIKERDLELGGFKGVEYISTLSATAQTMPVYIRQVILFDEHSNVLTVMGQPNNVTLGDGEGWREAYEGVDADNQQVFDQIVESIVVQ